MKILNKAFSLLFVLTFLSIPKIPNAADTINTTQLLRDGDTIVSSDGSFELGFFSLRNPKNRYVGMWYKKIKERTYIWVANRDVPLTYTSGVLTVVSPGRLAILNHTDGGIIWSSNTSRSVKNPVAKLLDSGNLVVKDANDDDQGNFLWESFYHPTDTILPGMKFGWNLVTVQEVYLTSWKNKDDPSRGSFTYHLNCTGYPQRVIKNGSEVRYKSGPWNGLRFSDRYFKYGVVYNKKEAYFSYDLISSVISRLTLNVDGVSQRLNWVDRQGWEEYIAAPRDRCDTYKLCGPYGSCNIANSPICGCLHRFLPKDRDAWWNRLDWSNGCVHRTPLNCSKGDVFLKYSDIKLPDTQHSWFNETMTLDECKVFCLKNCSCTAYSQLNISSGGSGCLVWFGDLINMREITLGQNIYIRKASTELLDSEGRDFENLKGRKSEILGVKKREILVVSLSLLTGMVLVCLSLSLYLQKKKKRYSRNIGGGWRHNFRNNYNDGIHNSDIELPMLDLYTIIKATNNFSIKNKLGEGGYGPVYKDGKEIAVKRLSKNSLQGIDEFRNEVNCIAKLQHRNLVKLLGCCIHEEEKMLIYEYLANRSLDLILFDPLNSALLDWPKRLHIINGIARGLMYLHQDSSLRIIHRDLKANNILLDSEMNPKISDFGLARSFGGNETGANTSRVAGTYGYMSPEYAIDGLFSVKSDVFSFGVLVLEIVSGQRNRGFSNRDHHHNLLGHAWMLYKQGRSMELVDTTPGISGYISSEVLRSIHVGLLCVQQCHEDRPTMSSVVFMLGNEVALPQAKPPGFFTGHDQFTTGSSNSQGAADSVNLVTITQLEGR